MKVNSINMKVLPDELRRANVQRPLRQGISWPGLRKHEGSYYLRPQMASPVGN